MAQAVGHVKLHIGGNMALLLLLRSQAEHVAPTELHGLPCERRKVLKPSSRTRLLRPQSQGKHKLQPRGTRERDV